MRGQETILISPNSASAFPAQKSRAVDHHHPSVRLDPARGGKAQRQAFRGRDAVSRRRRQGHAVPRHGGQGESRVDVVRGQVEVTDFKSGQFALVQPGQAAQVSAQGSAGLSLSGSGTLNPVQQGTPRSSSVSPLPTSPRARRPESKPAASAGSRRDVAAQTRRSQRFRRRPRSAMPPSSKSGRSGFESAGQVVSVGTTAAQTATEDISARRSRSPAPSAPRLPLPSARSGAERAGRRCRADVRSLAIASSGRRVLASEQDDWAAWGVG